MDILVVGDTEQFNELQDKFGSTHNYLHATDYRTAERLMETRTLVFDFLIDEEPDQFEIYAEKEVKVFFNTCKITLAELIHMNNNESRCTLFGFNGLPTFVNRPVLEVSLYTSEDRSTLQEICNGLGTEFLVVEDRVGLVTPRVISMIINEAYYTVQEGTATKDDIDLAMKLGTNYPYGPFEWCNRIGINHIYELLEAIYEDTKDERYKICPLLKQEYLKYNA